MSTPQEFIISVPDEDIAFLRRKLELTRFPDELDGSEWKYGVPLADVQRLVAHWKDVYDWRKHEKELNDELPQFTVDIGVEGFETLNIHFIHKKSETANAVPVLFVHGWPGSFIEVRKILPLLTSTTSDKPSFHVVALSLPGYGFSEGTKKQGFGLKQYCEVAHKLMLLLGYNEYVTQGGDWGFFVTRKMAALYGPKHVKAWHTNTSGFAGPPSLYQTPLLWMKCLITPWTAKEKEGLNRSMWFRLQGRGYFEEQSTQPQTLGYSLSDSPAGLLAWIYEKLNNWSDSYPWSDDEVLTWISIYWFSRAGPTASTRIYYEVGNAARAVQEPPVKSVPMGVSIFLQELVVVPKAWLHGLGYKVFESEHEKGGHFAAHERPQDLVDDLHKMFGKGGPAYNVVKGKDGY